ncbi:MAG: N-6 DNA methylase [Planctomycetota bacterium]
MALKKSQLYASLWSSCDELRGGMDASQYKDYVLVLLFLKYISDKYAGQPYAAITIPKGASFTDLVALKGQPDIGDRINKQVLGPLEKANKLSGLPDFNDDGKLGSGKEKVERLTNLIAIFENPALDFSQHRAGDDDLLGDAYEYLMRHFATESGKSKGQFYTPAEVSRIMAQLLGIRAAKTSAQTTVYDPTCGSGSLLLKVGDEATTRPTLYGQEKDATTAGLARMNMVLHDNPTAQIEAANTLTDARFKDGDALKVFDYVVANPPFSDKRWSTGLDPANDPHQRFQPFGIPPNKQGDYAYLLHIVRSLKSTGRGACILPHGVLFRGNSEAEIRRALVQKGYIEGIVGLPANLFYGTGIPACIVVIDKQHAHARKGIFLIDASGGFAKDGPKNRLRAQDIHRIVDTYRKRVDVPGYACMASVAAIEKHEFNLNLPRYIDSQAKEDLQDVAGHLQGGIPVADVDALAAYWGVCPGLRRTLFAPLRDGYVQLAVDKAAIRSAILEHPEFVAFVKGQEAHFTKWRQRASELLRRLEPRCHPKEVIAELSEGLLEHYRGQPLLDAYDVYQHLMDYWAATMQDDVHLIAADGWRAETYRIEEKDKKGKVRDKGWACDLVPKELVVAQYFAGESTAIEKLRDEVERAGAELAELEEEHGGDDGVFGSFDKINKQTVAAGLADLEGVVEGDEDAAVLRRWQELNALESEAKKRFRKIEQDLDERGSSHYPRLREADVKSLVVDAKWLETLARDVRGEVERLSHRLSERCRELAERYEAPMPALAARALEMEGKVSGHLQGAMQSLLIGTRRLPGFTGPWEKRSLGQLGSFLKGSGITRDQAAGGSLPCVRYGEIYTHHSEIVRSFQSWITRNVAATALLLRKGDLLFAGSGETKEEIGKCVAFIHDIEAYAGGDIIVLRPSWGDSTFLGYYLNSPTIVRQKASRGQGDAVVHISSRALGEVTGMFPQPAEQAAIAEVLADLDADIDATAAKLAKARAIKQGMMQELLTGRIRLA